MFGLGGWEIGILIVFGLLFFGPKKLPQLMRQAGKVMHEIRKASAEFQYSLERELEDDEYKRAHRRAKKRAKLLAEKGGDAPDPGVVAAQPVPSPAADAAGNGNGHAGAPAETSADTSAAPSPASSSAPAPDAKSQETDRN